MNPSLVAQQEQRDARLITASIVARRAYWRRKKRESRAAIRQWDPLYDRSRNRSHPRAIASSLKP